MGNINLIIKHKYKCCLSENIEEVESDDEDKDRQIIKQLPALETDEVSNESFCTTIPCNFKNK